jgi:Flp pilus assembly protein TadG
MALYAVLLMPMLLSVVALLLAAVQLAAEREQLRQAAGAGALAATAEVTSQGGVLQLGPDAVPVAERYLALSLASDASWLTPAEVAAAVAAAQVVVLDGSAGGPCGAPLGRPTVCVTVTAPVPSGLLTLAGLPARVPLSARATAALR